MHFTLDFDFKSFCSMQKHTADSFEFRQNCINNLIT